ncbi:LUD domain-containing protein [Thalassospira sp. FZY0004]|uniref:LUD domain-containing protein n=2 Tax=Thalassospiraceae TaxID=2844866 RepID=A0ABT6G992_9PROT|nr:LUD domain-containing protein [Thalassospira sp. FZY0004]MDG4718603.1 LUD domain-containing protein [Thalassospira sp. FZY0004]
MKKRRRGCAKRKDAAICREIFLRVTGPSRTGDIEQTIQLGAYGPRRLQIVLVDDTKETK